MNVRMDVKDNVEEARLYRNSFPRIRFQLCPLLCHGAFRFNGS